MGEPPRKRVSTSYKRYIKEHTGKEGVPLSSRRAFMESYNSVISQKNMSFADHADAKDDPSTTAIAISGTELLESMENRQVPQHCSADDSHCQSGGANQSEHDVVTVASGSHPDENFPMMECNYTASEETNQEFKDGKAHLSLFEHSSGRKFKTDEMEGSNHLDIEDTMDLDGYGEDSSSISSNEAFRDFNIDDELSEEECPVSEDDDFSVELDFDSYIYKGAQITLAVSVLLILTFSTRHSLTSDGITELLHLLALHCKAENCLPTTMYSFKKLFQNIEHPLVYHKYCSFCLLGIETTAGMDTCQNPLCGKNLNVEGSTSGFIEIPIESQLHSLFKRPGFIESLKNKSKHVKKNEDAIEDICDGIQYKKLVADGIVKSVYDLTLTFNTDGAKPFRSSKTSLWPIYFMINELSYTERRLPENMILAGIWYGPKKPSMTGFLNPFMKSLKGLEKGFTISTSEEEFNCKAILLASTCDLPARACVCAMNQYNGHSSCVKCLQTGKVVKVGKGHTRVFPPTMDNLNGPSRSDESVAKDALEAVRLKMPVRGIKGPSWFSYLTFFSFVHGTGIDYMHGVLLGVSKLMHSLWFASKHSCQVFSVTSMMDKVNRRLLQIKPPNYMSRLPRSLTDSDYWKASEWKYWLLYYAPTVMHDILIPEYFAHFLLLSEGIYLLLQDSILPCDVSRSRRLLASFVAMFPVMYLESSMTLNIHQLLHLPDDVLHLGPLWCFSCFPFEDANGFLLKLFNGTQHIDKQIAQSIAVMQKLPELMPSIEKDSVAYDLYCKLKNKSKHKGTFLSDKMYLIGASHFMKSISTTYRRAIEERVTDPIEKIVSFKRVKIDGDTYFSEAYRRVRLRNSFTVVYEDAGSLVYGVIEIFLQVSPVCVCEVFNCVCTHRNFAMIRCLPVSDDYMGVSYIRKVNRTDKDKITAIDLRALKRKCVFVKSHDSDCVFVCNIPNVMEKD